MHYSAPSSRSRCIALLGLGSALLLGSCGGGPVTTNAPTTSASPANSGTPATPQAAIDKQLIGQWKVSIPNPQGGNPSEISLIFSPEGKLYLIPLPGKALELQYKVNPTVQPRQLDVADGTATTQTIYEFTPDGQLRMQLENTNPNQPRPTTFSTNASVLKKASDSAALPPNTTVEKAEETAKKARQSEGKQYIGAINRAQQAYFLEKSQFATKLEDLGLGIQAETQNYTLRADTSDPKKLVQNIGVAKQDGLKSYAGFTYTGKGTTGDTTTLALLCESDQPTKEAPGKPQTEGDTVKCPTGYSPVQ